ncbi:MAG TPA: cytochrome P450 [Caulifigura sp.]|jgi:cytochrome P450|nr:cytochrome P450 [Caulifigura sp.]
MDLLSPEHLRNPHVAYGQLREASPVLHFPPANCWMLFDYESVRQALDDETAFSSRAHGHGGEPFDWMIFQDPPRHTRLRGLVQKAFTPRVIADLKSRISQISTNLLDQIGDATEFDVMSQLAAPLPMIVIAELLGIPAADRQQFQRWADATLGLALTLTGGEAAATAARRYGEATVEMGAYLTAQLTTLSTTPRDDLLSRLATAELDGERLTHAEILGFFQLLLLAGSETTANLIGNTLICLLEHPDQRSLLRRRPELLWLAVEETLRFRSPVQVVFRKTQHSVSLHGQTIARGELVLAVLGSANRDPRVFLAPERFEIKETPSPHLAFGYGRHFCLGAALARQEAAIALGQFLERFPDFNWVESKPWTPRPTFHVHGPSRLWLKAR